MSKTINVMFSCDDRIAKYIVVVLLSFYETHPDYAIDAFILENRVSEESKVLLIEFAQSHNQNMTIIHIEDVSQFEYFVDNCGGGKNIYPPKCISIYYPISIYLRILTVVFI